MASAILSLKQNRALLRKRKFRELKNLYLEKSGKTELAFKKISAEELAIIKEKIRKQAKQEAKHRIFISIISFILTISFLYLIYSWIVNL